MGNPILRDDAVGVRLAHELAARLGSQPGLHVVENAR
jgi:Ni,Fe-hydrogenase maturation factor